MTASNKMSTRTMAGISLRLLLLLCLAGKREDFLTANELEVNVARHEGCERHDSHPLLQTGSVPFHLAPFCPSKMALGFFCRGLHPQQAGERMDSGGSRGTA